MYFPAAKTVIFVCVFNSVFVRTLFIFATSSKDDNSDEDNDDNNVNGCGQGDDDGTVIMMAMMKSIDERLVFKRARCFVPDRGTDIGAWGVLSRHQIWR